MSHSDWRALNQANWDERVPIHARARAVYDIEALRAGTSRLDPIAAETLGPVEGLRVLHLQCHFGMDTLKIARLGAAAIAGVDFSPPAIAMASELAAKLGLSDRARFVEANVYNAPAAAARTREFRPRVRQLGGPLLDSPTWRPGPRVVASFLKPAAFWRWPTGIPRCMCSTVRPRRRRTARVVCALSGPRTSAGDRPDDYADPKARLRNSRTVEFLHPLSDTLTGLIEAGLRIDQFREHDSIVWKSFTNLVERAPGKYVWPDKAWLPLSFSLRATKS